MTHDEAEKLARNVLRFLPQLHSSSYPWYGQVQSLANSILSGSMKREIENAAFERAAQELDERKWMNGPEAAKIVRALIHPPAQKENGE